HVSILPVSRQSARMTLHRSRDSLRCCVMWRRIHSSQTQSTGKIAYSRGTVMQDWKVKNMVFELHTIFMRATRTGEDIPTVVTGHNLSEHAWEKDRFKR